MARTLSIRRKITLGFGGILALLIATALMTYGITLQVERRVELVRVMDDFLNTTLELRRFEKNYFLYGQDRDLADALFYWNRLQDFFAAHEAELVHLIEYATVQEIEVTLASYLEYLKKYHGVVGAQNDEAVAEAEVLAEMLRRKGKRLTEFAEQTASKEREAIRELLAAMKRILLVSVTALVAASLAFGFLLQKRVLSSLKLLEGFTTKIAQGEVLEVGKTGAVEEEVATLITAFKRMNQELKVRQRQLVQSEKLAAMGTLVAGVAHEINNPLSNISTSVEILGEELEGGDPGFKRQLIRQIEEQTDKARDIVRTLLDFSRSREFTRENLSLAGLLNETLRLVKGEIPPGVEIHIDMEPELTLSVDKQRMQQVFLNLFKNSFDALADKGNIVVSAQRIETETGPIVEILFEDDGPGIPPGIQERIFDPFFTTKDVGKGSGLGLFVVHDIIEAHGGDLIVDSRPGEGTRFVIWLREEERKNP